jgi:hypothetical protein
MFEATMLVAPLHGGDYPFSKRNTTRNVDKRAKAIQGRKNVSHQLALEQPGVHRQRETSHKTTLTSFKTELKMDHRFQSKIIHCYRIQTGNPSAPRARETIMCRDKCEGN